MRARACIVRGVAQSAPTLSASEPSDDQSTGSARRTRFPYVTLRSSSRCSGPFLTCAPRAFGRWPLYSPTTCVGGLICQQPHPSGPHSDWRLERFTLDDRLSAWQGQPADDIHFVAVIATYRF